MLIKELVDTIYIEQNSKEIGVYAKKDLYVRGYEDSRKVIVFMIEGMIPVATVHEDDDATLLDYDGNTMEWDDYRELTRILADFVYLLPSYHTHANKTLLDSLTSSGNGELFLSNDGTYKPLPESPYSTLLSLEDTPSDYAGFAGKSMIVNQTENGIIFGDPTVVWGGIAGNIDLQEDLMALVDNKEDYLGDPASNGMMLVSDADGTRRWVEVPQVNDVRWGDIGGSISDQTDLKHALDNKSDKNHTHLSSQINDFDEAVSNNQDVHTNTTNRHNHINKLLLDSLVSNGSGEAFLADDGKYKSYMGIDKFIGLTDTPDDYSESAGMTSVVNADEDALAFEWRVRWRGEWSQGEYNTSDMVSDSGWTMIANKQTYDRAAPQPVGDPYFVFDGTMGQEQSPDVTTIAIGQRYTNNNGKYVTSYRVYVVGTTDYYYRLVYTDRTDPANPITKYGAVFQANNTGWININTERIIMPAGSVFDFLLLIENHGVAPTHTVLSYDYRLINNPTSPGSGEIIHARNAPEYISVNKYDQNGDQSSFLSTIKVGDDISVDDMTWDITDIIDQGSYYNFYIQPTTRASNGGVQDATFIVYAPAPVDYGYLADHWASNPNVLGLYAEDNYKAPTENDNAYGLDLEIQDMIYSDDWDIVARSL